MNIVLLGPPGSGKGTQAQLLAQKLGLTRLEMGRILRSVANSDNEYAPVVKQCLESGNLVPDEYIRLIAWDFINKHPRWGFVFEGYPRTVAQYQQLEDMLARFGQKIDLVVNLTISPAESVRRLSARRVCNKCGQIYNLVTSPSPNRQCQCGGDLVQRDDDQPQAIKRRLEIYQQQTQPVFEQAKKAGVGIEIDGQRPIEIIHQDLVSRVA